MKKCNKCGTEMVKASSMSYIQNFDERDPLSKDNYEHTHSDVAICSNCLMIEEDENI